jgi:hypothetical protein
MTAGLIAGAVMIAVALVVSAAEGNGFWFPAQLIGGAVFGVSAILGGTAPAITGLLTHFLWSAILGGIFGSLINRTTGLAEAIGGGLLFSVATWAVMTFAVLPWVNPTLSDRVALTPYWWFAYHLVWGATLSCAAPLQRAFLRSEHVPYPGFERTKKAA